jgi:hypothetical protein
VEPIPGIQDNALRKKETLFVYSIIWFMTSGAPGLTVGEIVKIYRHFSKMARIEIYLPLWIIFTKDGRKFTLTDNGGIMDLSHRSFYAWTAMPPWGNRAIHEEGAGGDLVLREETMEYPDSEGRMTMYLLSIHDPSTTRDLQIREIPAPERNDCKYPMDTPVPAPFFSGHLPGDYSPRPAGRTPGRPVCAHRGRYAGRSRWS